MIKFVILVLLLAVSCRDKDLKFNFPEDIKYQCDVGFNSAKTCIESKGISLERLKGLTVVKHPGEKYFGVGQGWGWKSPEWKGMYVLGLCWGTRIEVGSNPVTGGQVEQNVINHEMGHYWLMTNHNINKHIASVASCFHNWVDPQMDYRGDKEGLQKLLGNIKSGTRINAHITDSEGNNVVVQLIKE